MATMNPDQFCELYQELQSYVGWSDEDVQQLRRVAPVVEPHLDRLIDDFYTEIQRHPRTLKVITGGTAQIQRLKQSLRRWLQELLAANCDREYVLRRWQIGWRHVEIGLPQVFTNAALSRLRTGLVRIVQESVDAGTESLAPAIASLNKLLDLDLAIIEDAYQAEFIKRQERAERLAAIGALAGGVAHELRNPLGVITNAVYFLRSAQPAASDDARDAYDEINRGLATSNRLTSELLDYVREPKREETAFPLSEVIEAALADIELPASIQLSAEQVDAVGRADKGQVTQILGNLFRNAAEAMPDGGRLTLVASRRDNTVVLELEDTGAGIAVEDLERVFEPLFSRKTRGIGLGLAVSRRYAELNHGRLEVESQLGHGATFRLTLPAADNQGEAR